jgi:hypothetical protein
LCYATIYGGGYRPQIQRFELRNSGYLQSTTPITLDVTIGCVILCMHKVLPFGVLLLEGRDGQTWKDHVRNCAPCPLPNVDDQIDPFLIIVLASLRCMLYEQTLGITIMLICDN